MPLVRLFVQVGVILLVVRLIGLLFARINQPKVVGEMAAGILLGPSVLGWLAPAISAAVFPPDSIGNLNVLSQMGLVLFMFLVGLMLHPRELRESGHTAVLVSHVSIVFPFTLAAALALLLYPRLSDSRVQFTGFALFMGASMSITAFPVLARILTERDMVGTRLGTLAIACAAIDDVTGWCILAYIVVLVRAARSATPLWVTVAGSVAFFLLMIFGVRRLLKRFETYYADHGKLSENAIAIIILLVIASALTTEALGVHLLFGAFLAGVVMPKNEVLVDHIRQKFESVTLVLLLPLFFAYTGLRTRLGLLHGAEMWAECAIIVIVAVAGKLGGSMAAARLAGMPLRDAAALGVLMNTRGLMELVVLNIGLDIGVISPALFSMMVLMALATTFMTSPLLSWLCPDVVKVHETAPEFGVRCEI